MTTTESHPQFIVDSFNETRAPKPYRVFHPFGDPDDWKSLRNKYDNRSRFGHGSTEVPKPGPTSVLASFNAEPDRFLIHANREQLTQNHRIVPNQAWIGINRPADNKIVWLPLDTDHLRIRNYRQIPQQHLETDSYVIRGAVGNGNEDDIMAQLQPDTGLPDLLLEYQEDDDGGYEVTVHVPRARTIRYDQLRADHIPA